jgi:RHS repeat-associated protein
MEIIAVARILRALSVRHSNTQLKRFTAGASLGAFLALLALTPLAMSDAQATTAVGAIRGSSAVTSSGAAAYSIPIQVSPGTHGMQPSLALVYNSQGGDGWAGYGWALSGLSAITRCPQNPEDDNITNNLPVHYVIGDDYCLDGQKLRLTGTGTSGGNATYGTQIEGFSVVTSYAGTNGPSYFTVQTKDGRVYEYGNTPDSGIVAEGTSTIRTWALDKVTDASGNFMTYQYSGSAVPGREYWPVSIKYTANGSTVADHEVDFTFATRPWGTVTRYTHDALSRNSIRLTTITSKYLPSTTVYTYNLTYEATAPVNNRDRLISVQECGEDGSCLPVTSIAWSSSYSGWLADTSTGVSVGDAAHATAAHLMDVDGDGIADLVYPDTTTDKWMVLFGSPSGGFVSSPVNTGVSENIAKSAYAIATDYNGDGLADLAVPTTSGWQVLVSTGNRTPGAGGIFVNTTNNLPTLTANNSDTGLPMYQGNVWMADFSGGSLPDMFYNTGSAIEWLQNGGLPSETFASATAVYSGATINSGNRNRDYIDVGLDFNGSGRVGALIYNNTSGNWLGLNPSGNTLGMFGTISGSATVPAVPFDANGDGLTDLLTVDNSTPGNWQISLAEGNVFHTALASSEVYSNMRDPLVVDYYGDGTQVALVYNPSTSAWDLLDAGYNTSTGNFAIAVTSGVSAPYNSTILTGSVRVGSIEWRGWDDLVYSVLGGGVYTWHYRLHNGATSVPPDLVTSVTDGLGNNCQFAYTTLSAGTSFTRGNYVSYPVHSIQNSMAVVSTYTESDGMGGSYNFAYTYSDARVDTQGRGFLGFATRTVTDSRTGNVETTSFDQTFPYVGMVTQDKVDKSNGDHIRETDNGGAELLSLAPGSDGSQRYFPFFDTSTTHDYDNMGGTVQETRTGVTTLSAANFDSYGDVTDEVATVTDMTHSGHPAYTTETVATFAPASGNYCVELPASVTVTRTVPSGSLGATFPTPASRIMTYTPDTAHCREFSKTSASGQSGDGSIPLTASYTYDAYGNLTEADLSATGLTTRVQQASFTNQNNEFPVSGTAVVSGTLSLTSNTTWRYDLGVPTVSTDPNGNQTKVPTTAYDSASGYDGFGRIHQVTRPDGSASVWDYVACSITGPYCPSGAAYDVAALQVSSDTTPVVIVTGYKAYDMRGRVIEQGTVLLSGIISRVDTVYDSLGNVLRISKPYTGSVPSYWTRYTYDTARGRVTQIDAPQDAADTCSGTPPTCSNHQVTTLSYSGFTVTASEVVTNSASSSSTHTVQTVRDVLGDMLKTVDSNTPTAGLTLYNYDAFGELVATQDANSKKTYISYDGLGHKTGMTDPNLGAWSYFSDALGEGTCQKDAKHQYIIFSYDSIGRLIGKRETAANDPNGCLSTSGYAGTWAYDQAGALGLPKSVSDSNGFSRAYDYDSHGRPLHVTTTIPSVPPSTPSTYVSTIGYDNFDRVSNLTYPDTGTGAARFEVTYNYDSTSGALSSVSDTATSFVYWQVATGGSSVPVDAFGHILGYVDGNGVSTVSTYDQATGATLGIGTGIGSSTAIQQLAYSWDGFGNLKSRCDANKNLTETFGYDALDRITASTVKMAVSSCSGGATGAVIGMTYDAIGNIQTRTNSGITSSSGNLNQGYSYGDPSHPDAVTTILDNNTLPSTPVASYAYDANGNMTSGNGRSITWNDDNLPTYISSTSTVSGNNAVTGTSNFSYGPDLQRYQQTATDSNIVGNTTTTYVSGLFEVVNTSSSTQYRHNIVTGSGVVAVHTLDQSGTPTTEYIHSDHLGSSDTITDHTGAIVQQSSFDAFGLRRNPLDWSYSLTANQISVYSSSDPHATITGLKTITDQGYTSQEQLDSVGLVHMNGRVYDPSIGRFISADPTVPNPFYSQAFNRYAYVYNNPLAMIDPSGFSGEAWGDWYEPDGYHAGFYADSSCPQGCLHIEITGHYDPMSPDQTNLFGGDSGSPLVDINGNGIAITDGNGDGGSTQIGLVDVNGSGIVITGDGSGDSKGGSKRTGGGRATNTGKNDSGSGLGQKPSPNGQIAGNCGGGSSNCVPMSNNANNEGDQEFDGVFMPDWDQGPPIPGVRTVQDSGGPGGDSSGSGNGGGAGGKGPGSPAGAAGGSGHASSGGISPNAGPGTTDLGQKLTDLTATVLGDISTGLGAGKVYADTFGSLDSVALGSKLGNIGQNIGIAGVGFNIFGGVLAAIHGDEIGAAKDFADAIFGGVFLLAGEAGFAGGVAYTIVSATPLGDYLGSQLADGAGYLAAYGGP